MTAMESTTYTFTASEIELFELISNGIESFDLSQTASSIKSRVLQLLEGGANPNARVPVDGSTVRIACMNHPHGVVDGPTVLIACVNNSYGFVDFSVAKLLLEWGADPTATYGGMTAVEWIGYDRIRHNGPYLKSLINRVAAVQARAYLSRGCNKKHNNSTTTSTYV
jgi:hypothetical protein